MNFLPVEVDIGPSSAEQGQKIGDQAHFAYVERMSEMMGELCIGPFARTLDAPIWSLEQ